ncbi:unnamed protein product, partial [Allacma fusca]
TAAWNISRFWLSILHDLSPRKRSSGHKCLLEAANDNSVQDPVIATRIWEFVDPLESKQVNYTPNESFSFVVKRETHSIPEKSQPTALQCDVCGAQFGKQGIIDKHLDLKHTTQIPVKY